MHGAPGRPSRPPASRKSTRRAAAEGQAPEIHEVSASRRATLRARLTSHKTSIRPLSERRNIAKPAACDTRSKARKAGYTRFLAAAYTHSAPPGTFSVRLWDAVGASISGRSFFNVSFFWRSDRSSDSATMGNEISHDSYLAKCCAPASEPSPACSRLISVSAPLG
jgi:hypothetical protein